jgi:Zn-dependent protease with chaperone function
MARVASMLEDVSERAGITPPKLSIVDAEQINAFALQGDGEATISVTKGFLDNLDDEQAEALLALQVARVESGAAESASVGALIAGWIAHLASFRMAGRTDVDVNPLAVPTATLAAPFAGFVRRTFMSERQERLAEVMAVELIQRPMALVRALQRAEFTAHVKPMTIPAALAGTAVVNPHLGAPGTALTRVYGMGRPVSERFPEFMWDDAATTPATVELQRAA